MFDCLRVARAATVAEYGGMQVSAQILPRNQLKTPWFYQEKTGYEDGKITRQARILLKFIVGLHNKGEPSICRSELITDTSLSKETIDKEKNLLIEAEMLEEFPIPEKVDRGVRNKICYRITKLGLRQIL